MLRNCFARVGMPLARRRGWSAPRGGPAMSAVTLRSRADKASVEDCSSSSSSSVGEHVSGYAGKIKTAVDQMLAAYRDTDYEKTLDAAPRHVLWTALVPVAALGAKMAIALTTLNCGDFSSAAVGHVSLYVTFGNAWWLLQASGDRGDPSAAPFWRLQKCIAPATMCAVAVLVFPKSVCVGIVSCAALWMTNRLIADNPSAVPWFRSLVLIVNGVAQLSLMLALICSLFSH